MTWKDTALPVLSRLPSVTRPEGHVEFRDKLKWTAVILVLYFFLTNIQVWGLGAGSSDAFGQFRSLLAGSFGSILTLGIGPIVTASIVLQLLSGANLLGFDMDDPRDQALYQGLQKMLVFVMILLTGLPMVFGGGFLSPAPAMIGIVPLGKFGLKLVMLAQICVGGVFILYMDEVISKWGVGSGVGLFIIAGVSQSLFGGFAGWQSLGGQNGILVNWYLILTGQLSIGSIFAGPGFSALLFGVGSLLALFTTVFIFVTVVYAESVRVEIPLSNANVKGARGRFPVKLIYASVLPMILVRAIQANIQFVGNILNAQLGENMPAWLGVYNGSGSPVSGLFYYLAPIYSPQDWMWWLGSTTNEVWQILLRTSIDLTIMVVGGAIFAIFWVETTDMGPEATAEQIHNSGMEIPGFRRSPKVIERVLERYIPVVTVLGGAIVGVLAVMANMLGTIGGVSGTGLLLTVSITYKLYEEIAEEAMLDMHPMMRKMFGNE